MCSELSVMLTLQINLKSLRFHPTLPEGSCLCCEPLELLLGTRSKRKSVFYFEKQNNLNSSSTKALQHPIQVQQSNPSCSNATILMLASLHQLCPESFYLCEPLLRPVSRNTSASTPQFHGFFLHPRSTSAPPLSNPR